MTWLNVFGVLVCCFVISTQGFLFNRCSGDGDCDDDQCCVIYSFWSYCESKAGLWDDCELQPSKNTCSCKNGLTCMTSGSASKALCMFAPIPTDGPDTGSGASPLYTF
ncbi:uncharacterized protein LOC135483700 [Lineus longissimus]|uniref:uncharacterized protein LOC135483700 n=1 Tax=Lineus longissimus TaxID=88925 RepID=UPI002B4C9202